AFAPSTRAAAAAVFNTFDAGFCDAFPGAFLREGAAVFFAFATPVPPGFSACAFAVFFERTLAAFAVADLPEVLGDFLRVFLDIRLPFDAFGGSTNRVLRVLPCDRGFAPDAGQF